MNHDRSLGPRPLHLAPLLVPMFLVLLPGRSLERTASAQATLATATLISAPMLRLPGGVDSNSPAVWDLISGSFFLHVVTSFGGEPSVSSGLRLSTMGDPRPVTFVSRREHGLWMETIVPDDTGTWYGYYHTEIPAHGCGRPDRAIPRIGAARSVDRGQSWEDLGIILEAPRGAQDCNSPNPYFLGGVGDLTALLDQDSKYLYVFFSQYSRSPGAQGVAVGRLPWAARDEPVGRLEVWADGIFLPATHIRDERDGPAQVTWRYPGGTPLVRPAHPWHDDDPVTDAFWGPAVHWNTHLKEYVMLLNRTRDEAFAQEGIYISFAPVLDDPTLWSAPERILEDGMWYPQVIGLEEGTGTDKRAGARARFFMGGTSTHLIEFSRRGRRDF